jgi:RNA polymerase sigma-70 factor (ECF subfamily)
MGSKKIRAIKDSSRLASYPFYSATLGELEFRRGKYKAARKHFRAALSITRNPLEPRFLDQRVKVCEGGDTQQVT